MLQYLGLPIFLGMTLTKRKVGHQLGDTGRARTHRSLVHVVAVMMSQGISANLLLEVSAVTHWAGPSVDTAPWWKSQDMTSSLFFFMGGRGGTTSRTMGTNAKK